MKDSILATAELNVIYSRGEQSAEGGPRLGLGSSRSAACENLPSPRYSGREGPAVRGKPRPRNLHSASPCDERKSPRPVDQPESPGGTEMSPAQMAQVKAILSKYDESSLTAADARAINEAFREAGTSKRPRLAAGHPRCRLRSGEDRRTGPPA